ncbi:MAG: hypothetical protein JWO67_3277 [Streptosporangiaceae bacterium]|nr:hypothetical protein [Streptosporangiaceae bacterium]
MTGRERSSEIPVPVPYLEQTPDPGWREMIDGVPWTPFPTSEDPVWYQKRTSCPRCGCPDGVSVSKDAEGYVGIRAAGRRRFSPSLHDVFVKCQCHGDHLGRPSGSLGCGCGDYVSGPVAGGTP